MGFQLHGKTLSLLLLLLANYSFARISPPTEHGDRELKEYYEYEEWKEDKKDSKDNNKDENGDPYAPGLGICGIEDKCGEYGFNLYNVRAVSQDGTKCESRCTMLVNIFKDFLGYTQCGSCACDGVDEAWKCGSSDHNYCGEGSNDELCECTRDVEGNKFCMEHTASCSEASLCQSSLDCESGSRCVPSTCCNEGFGTCFPSCTSPNLVGPVMYAEDKRYGEYRLPASAGSHGV